MNKRFSIWLLATVFLTSSVAAQAQSAKKVHRIGYLSGFSAATEAVRAEAVRRALRELGYVEGENLVTEYQHSGGKDDLVELAAELARLKVDLIVLAGGDNEIVAAMKATKTIPLIMTGSGSDPVRAGFIESLARPGGNVTGLTRVNRELGGKRLEIFKEAVPKLSRVAALFSEQTPGIAREVKEDLTVAARALGLTVQPRGVRDGNDFERPFAAIVKERPDGLYVSLAGNVMRVNRKRVADFALQQRFPSFFDSSLGVDAGGTIYYGSDVTDSYPRIAFYIDKILKGAKPAELPVEQPMKFELVINLKTAKQIGVNIVPEVLARATRIIR